MNAAWFEAASLGEHSPSLQAVLACHTSYQPEGSLLHEACQQRVQAFRLGSRRRESVVDRCLLLFSVLHVGQHARVNCSHKCFKLKPPVHPLVQFFTSILWGESRRGLQMLDETRTPLHLDHAALAQAPEPQSLHLWMAPTQPLPCPRARPSQPCA